MNEVIKLRSSNKGQVTIVPVEPYVNIGLPGLRRKYFNGCKNGDK